MQIKNSHARIHKQQGVTLLETVVYVSLLSVLTVTLVASLLNLNQSLHRLVINRVIDDAAQELMEKIVREVRFAGSVDGSASTFGVNPSYLTLNSTDVGGTPQKVEFFVSGGRLEMERDDISVGFLTPIEISIDEFILDYISTPVSEAVKVSLLLSGTRGNVSTSETFNTTVLLRGSY